MQAFNELRLEAHNPQFQRGQGLSDLQLNLCPVRWSLRYVRVWASSNVLQLGNNNATLAFSSCVLLLPIF